jgi:hypothetical protein
MNNNWRLSAVRAAHTLIYLVMASATVLVLFAGLTGATGGWLHVALALVLLEAAIFIGSGMKCPLTAVAVRYGATHDGHWDTFLPERCTRHTLTVFGPMMLFGVALLLICWFIAGR